MTSSTEIVAHQLRNLGAELGRNDLSFADGKSVNLALDSGLTVALEWDEESEQLVVFSAIQDAPRNNEQRLDLFQKLLEYNCMQIGSLGGVLSYHPPSNAVLFHVRATFTSEVGNDALKTLVLDFAGRATVVLAELHKALGGGGGRGERGKAAADQIRA